jgi:hypothetical protein
MGNGSLSLGVKWHEAYHSPPTTAEVKKVLIYTSTSPCLDDVVLTYLSTGTTLPFTYDLTRYFEKYCKYWRVCHLHQLSWHNRTYRQSLTHYKLIVWMKILAIPKPFIQPNSNKWVSKLHNLFYYLLSIKLYCLCMASLLIPWLVNCLIIVSLHNYFWVYFVHCTEAYYSVNLTFMLTIFIT